MKVKEIPGTCHFAWSPAEHYLVCGTAAQQLDATFSTTAALELWKLDMGRPGLEAEKCANLVMEQRFHQLAWGSQGVIVAGTGGGCLLIYSPDRLKAGQSDILLAQHTHHTGPVRALDFNPFQPHLLASGAGESTILVWDLKAMGKPMAPGSASLPTEDVTSVAWNHQVQYILASSFHSRCVVWDLRKNEPIIKVSDSSRVRCKVVAWHPEVATQMCLASEDDHCPVVELWDLRFATSPLKTLEHHQAGVLSIAWCPWDPDLLLSCGKDNQLLCWNPNANLPGGDLLCCIPLDTQWNFSVQWSPCNPALLATSSFDGKLSVHSILGASPLQPNHHLDSFPGTLLTTKLQTSASQSYLKKPPKWLRRTCGASFGFGGKLVIFSKSKGSQVLVSQVVTDPDLISRAEKLESALNSGDLSSFCLNKINSLSNPELSLLWSFVKSTLDDSPRSTKLTLLGFDGNNLASQMNNLAICDESLHKVVDYHPKITKPKMGNPALIHALLIGKIDVAVNLCIQEASWPEAFILAQAGGPELFRQTQENYLQISSSPYAQLLSAIVADEWDDLVNDVTTEGWHAVLGALLSYAPMNEISQLCDALGERLANLGLTLEGLLCHICSGNAEKLAKCWSTALPGVGNEALSEMIIVLRVLQHPLQSGPYLSSMLISYLEELCHQGALALAAALIKYLDISSLRPLHDRILPALLPPKTCHHSNNNIIHDSSDSYKFSNYQSHNSNCEPLSQSTPFSHPGRVIPTSTYQSANVPFHSKYENTNNTYSPAYSQLPTANPQSFYSSNYITPSTQTVFSSNTLSHSSSFVTSPQNSNPSPLPSNFFTPASSSPTDYGKQSLFPQSHGINSQPPINYVNPVFAPPITPAYSPGIPASMSSSISIRKPLNKYGIPSAPASNIPSPPGNNIPLANSMSMPSANTMSLPPLGSMCLSKENILHPLPTSNMPLSPVNQPSPPITPPPQAVKPGWNDPPTIQTTRGPSRSRSSSSSVIPYSGSFYDPTEHLGKDSGESIEPPSPPDPVEHRVIQVVLEGLREQCLLTTSNPQHCRKLEEVSRRLENLYDKLRHQSLPAPALDGLHQIVHSIQNSDFLQALNLHNQLVSGANFSDISSFMPGIKVLLQTATILRLKYGSDG